MRTVADYRRHAEECRKLAKLAANPEDKKVFEDMAHHWDMLADLRIGDIEPEDQRASVPPEHSGTKRFRSIN
jgi:ribosome-binding protein aMBF1 (putative translation factor)